jgi:D-alanyl-D-alanine carboxypeptidase
MDRFVPGFGMVTRRQRRVADLFFADLTGAAPRRRLLGARSRPWQPMPSEQVVSAGQTPYLPAGGRNFVPQQGTFNCAPGAFTVIPASFLPQRTTDPDAAIDAALTAAGLVPAQRARIARAGLTPIAAEFGAPALTELFARLRWSAAEIVERGRGVERQLVQRLLLHIPGHFRELARRARTAVEAFVLECVGWLLMAQLRNGVASASGRNWWLPPAPDFVTVVPNPLPPVSSELSRLLVRFLLIDTLMTADAWNARLMTWGTGPAGLQWQAEIGAPQPGRPFYAAVAAIPPHVNTAAARANFTAGWALRVADTDARNAPMPAGAAAVTLSGLLNAAALRECDNGNAHLPAGALSSLVLAGLELASDMPFTQGSSPIRRLQLLAPLQPTYTALFQTIRALGWNDLLYQTSGGGCFRGIKHPASARVTIAGAQVSVDPFGTPNATTVTRINTAFTPAQRARVVAAARTARTLSEHGLGAAIDFNVPENEQDVAARPFGSMDPRIVAIFEAFNFRFGACFNPTDPMHFEYCQAPCAPVAAAAGVLGRVVTPNMLMRGNATGNGTMLA